MMYISFK
ncbi:Protein of unknown function [Gryllus bimaculatus]|nr:Protein of unknown function [Gryllus bimaculatus]